MSWTITVDRIFLTLHELLYYRKYLQLLLATYSRVENKQERAIARKSSRATDVTSAFELKSVYKQRHQKDVGDDSHHSFHDFSIDVQFQVSSDVTFQISLRVHISFELNPASAIPTREVINRVTRRKEN